MTIARHIFDPATGRAIFVTPDDPSLLGLDGPIGSLANKDGGGRFWSKFGPAVTDWSEFAASSGFLPLSGGSLNPAANLTVPGTLTAGGVLVQANTAVSVILNSTNNLAADYTQVIFQRGGVNQWRFGQNISSAGTNTLEVWREGVGAAVSFDATGGATFLGTTNAQFVRAMSTYGWTMGNMSSVPRIIYGNAGVEYFSMLTASNAYADLQVRDFSAAGHMFLGNSFNLNARNAANTAYIQLLGLNASNQVRIDVSGFGTFFGGGIQVGGVVGLTTQVIWPNVQWTWATAAHQKPANSFMLYDQYVDDGGLRSTYGVPVTYGTLMHIVGRSGHLDSQLLFGEAGQILYRSAFYGVDTWGGWYDVLSGRNSGTMTGNSRIDFGPNLTYSSVLRIGGDAPVDGAANILTTNGTLHLNSKTGAFPLYLNYHNGGNPVNVGPITGTNALNVYGSTLTQGYFKAGVLGYGLMGIYDPMKYQGVFTMGTDYQQAGDGTNLGNLYGLYWAYDHVSSGKNITGLTTRHGLGMAENGTTKWYFGCDGMYHGGYAVFGGSLTVQSHTILNGGIRQTGSSIVRFENTAAAMGAGGSGPGLEVGVSSGTPYIQAYNRTSSLFTTMAYYAASHSFNASVGITDSAPTLSVSALGATQLAYIYAQDFAGRIVGMKSSNNTTNPKIGSFTGQDMEFVRAGVTFFTLQGSSGIVAASGARFVGSSGLFGRSGAFEIGNAGNSLYFGHANTEYRASIGAQNGAGLPFISLYSYLLNTSDQHARSGTNTRPSRLIWDISGVMYYQTGAQSGTPDAVVSWANDMTVTPGTGVAAYDFILQ